MSYSNILCVKCVILFNILFPLSTFGEVVVINAHPYNYSFYDILNWGNITQIMGPKIQEKEVAEYLENYLVPEDELNFRPIIGVLSEGISPEIRKKFEGNFTSYIVASYVKFLEAGGARVVPVLLDQDDSYYKKMVKSLNGFLFPGGGADVTSNGTFGRTGKIIFDLVTRENANGNRVPIFGTCLGFEMLGVLASNSKNPLQECSAMNRADPVTFRPDFEKSRMFSSASKNILKILATRNVTSNFHTKCIFPQKFHELNMNASLRILSTSFDASGAEYISIFEHKTLPFYGTQWHPEKPQFEWTLLPQHDGIPHQREAIEVGQYMANFYVDEARRNKNQFVSKEEEEKSLIYNYSPVFLPPIVRTVFQQIYLFP